jgi:N utilization substance protein A
MPEREQIVPGTYHVGAYMKVFIFKVEQSPRGPKILVSRTHPDFVRRLFDIEVPEIYDKTVEIKNIVRDPGKRAKISVITTNPKVDPIGACVGVKGARVKAVISELEGERIDLIQYTLDSKAYITSALTPATVSDVLIDEEHKNAEVIVPDDQLSIAIGKQGHNVKLAARLTGWHLDVKSESQRREAQEKRIEDAVESLEALPGINDKIAALLVAAGYNSVKKLSRATKEELLGLQGIGDKTADKIIAAVAVKEDEHAKG